ncbi:MAG: hypothetical protein LUE13_04170 [Akkermansiaceae bacterium]|nr:hypothetical protein [Akkermansiaceae bacterium]
MSSIYVLYRQVHDPDYDGPGAACTESHPDFTWHEPPDGHGNAWASLRSGNQVAYAFRTTDNPPYLRRIDVFIDNLATERKE